MDFSWPPEYLAYRDKVVAFAKEYLNDDILERDREGIFARDLWNKCGEFGIQGMAAPQKYGGSHPEVDILRAVLAMEGLGYACRDTGLVLGLNAHMWAVQMSINLFGTEAQKEKFLPPMARGEWIGAHALTEAESGSDVFNMHTRAEKTEGGYLLNGEKRLVTLAPIADVAVVFANTNPQLGKWGVTAFIVEKDRPGFMASPTREKMGLRTVPIGEIKFDNCLVPEENRLGKEGAG
ncbi:MAG: acyl-CoA dehydrogenase family protein, partial [Bacteroidota bacterium]